MTKPKNRYFAVVPPGFEKICAAELQRLGVAETAEVIGGVEFGGDLRELYLANLWLRSPTRILVRIGELQARDFPTLFKKMVRLPWGRFVKPGCGIKVRATSHRSRLAHTGRLEQTCRDAIGRALGAAPEGVPEAVVYLRLDDDHCQVSLDSSGDLLHRRGYRKANVAAPLRENLAAACLLALGYDGSQTLVDGMTGSGTFAIEAALIAARRAPGGERSFAFMAWPKYREGLWRQLLEEARRTEVDPMSAIIAVDSNPKAIAAAQQNLQAAGVEEHVRLDCRPLQQLIAATGQGLIVCNPPYGERLGRTAALQALYRDLGRVYHGTFNSWQGALICPDSELVRATGIDFVPLLRFSNGGIRVALLEKRRKWRKTLDL